MPSTPMLEHVGIIMPRDKVEAALNFYEQVFGWHRIREVGGTMYFIGDGQGGRMELVVGDAPPLAAPHHVAFVLPMDQLDAAIEALNAAGVQPDPVQTTAAGDKLLYFRDPAGNYVQIVCRVTPMGN